MIIRICTFLEYSVIRKNSVLIVTAQLHIYNEFILDNMYVKIITEI